MFEYLMPLLVMPTYENTLLDQTCKAAVERRMRVWQETRRAVGHFRSGYNAIDIHLNYRSRAFGVPGWIPDADWPKIWSLPRMPQHWR